jgi:hypothetical protein
MLLPAAAQATTQRHSASTGVASMLAALPVLGVRMQLPRIPITVGIKSLQPVCGLHCAVLLDHTLLTLMLLLQATW